MAQPITTKEDVKYSKQLSSLFSSLSIICLSILCLLNNQTLDIYSAIILLKVVAPCAFCYWFSGFVIGKIFDSFTKKRIKQKKINEEKAYEIPSMFSMGGGAEESNDIF